MENRNFIARRLTRAHAGGWPQESGDLSKKVTAEGPEEEGACGLNVIAVVHVEGRVKGFERPFASTRGNDPIKFTVGASRVVPALDYGVATMRRGERALFTCAPHMVAGFPGAPANCVVDLDVELVCVGP